MMRGWKGSWSKGALVETVGRAAQVAFVGLALVIALIPVDVISLTPLIESHDIPRAWIYFPVIGLLISFLIPQVAVVLALRSRNT